MWTPERIAGWWATGARPKVAMWPADLTGPPDPPSLDTRIQLSVMSSTEAPEAFFFTDSMPARAARLLS